MRSTIVLSAAVVGTYLSALCYGAVVHKRQDDGSDDDNASYQVCIYDALYNGLWSYTPNAYEASSVCNSLLGNAPSTTCIGTNTVYTTTFPAANTTRTITRGTTIAANTATVTSTAIVFGVKKRYAEASPGPTAPPIALPRGLPKGDTLDESIAKRQLTDIVSASNSVDLTRSLISACACNTDLTATTLFETCAVTVTKTNDVVTIYTQTVYTTVTSGVTTITETVNVTSKIDTTASFNPPQTSWTIPVNNTGVWSLWAYTTTTSSDFGSSSTTSSMEIISTTMAMMTTTTTTTSLETDPVIQSTTTSASITSDAISSSTAEPSSTTDSTSDFTTTTTTSASSTTTPSGCPYIDGTLFDENPDQCTAYEYACSQTYADSDFYDSEQYWPTAEGCTNVCDSMNTGGRTACLGIVWNTTSVGMSANCRQLKSIDFPTEDDASVALILVPDTSNPLCTTSTTTTTTTTTTTMATYDNTTTTTTRSRTWHPWTGIWNDTITNGSWSDWHWNKTYTTTSNNTSTIGPVSTTANLTTTTTTSMSSNSTTINTPYTWTTPFMTGGTGIGSGTGLILPTANSSCSAPTLVIPTTVYATMFETVTIPANGTQIPSVVTVTVTNAAPTETETETETLMDTVTVTVRRGRNRPWTAWRY